MPFYIGILHCEHTTHLYRRKDAKKCEDAYDVAAEDQGTAHDAHTLRTRQYCDSLIAGMKVYVIGRGVNR